MHVGVGLPTTVPGAPGESIVEWAKEIDRSAFATIATLDRLVYDSYESLAALAAAAAVTERAKLMTSILISPLRSNVALLAKQVATIDRLSGGRLVLGVGVGSRPDDFKASGVEMAGRGTALEGQVAEARRIWAGERRGFAGGIGPATAGPPVLIGGYTPKAIDRAARIGDGWISGGGGVGIFRQGAGMFRAGWQEHGRTGKPRVVALAYFALGANAEELAGEYLSTYYGFAPPYAQMVLANTPKGSAALRQTIEAYDEAGCDELLLSPCGHDLSQLKELRETLHL
jgi:alkanesulfonate monooxygenase SsuD/methylene tetrahydromethanopterin reductase-like flavin-dependent oxidoreductase (luciferase family)